MYPQRAHCPMVEPETPASSPASPARNSPWGLGRALGTPDVCPTARGGASPSRSAGLGATDLVGQLAGLVVRRAAGLSARIGVVEQALEIRRLLDHRVAVVTLDLGLEVPDHVVVADHEVAHVGAYRLVLLWCQPQLLAAAVLPALAEVARGLAVLALLPAGHALVGDAERRLRDGHPLSSIPRHAASVGGEIVLASRSRPHGGPQPRVGEVRRAIGEPREPDRELGDRHRTAHEEALRLVALPRGEPRPGRVALDALGDHAHAEAVPEVDEGMHDRRVALVVDEPHHE